MSIDLTTSESSNSSGLHMVQEALLSGKTQAATTAFHELAAQCSDPDELGRDLASTLRKVKGELCIEPLKAFLAWLRNHPAWDMVESSVSVVADSLGAIDKWGRTLDEVASERTARDLRFEIRSRNLSNALELSKRILLNSRTSDERLLRTRQLGTILGSMGQDRPRTEKLLNQITKERRSLQLDEEMLQTLRDTHDDTQSKMSLVAMGEHERQWNLIHIDSVVKILRKLPGQGGSHIVGQEAEDVFYDALQAPLAAYFLKAKSYDSREALERFHDLVRILREFCPAEEKKTGPVEGVEDVAFLRIPTTDRLISLRAMKRLGESQRLVELILQAAKATPPGRRTEMLLYLMGGLSNVSFFPLLSKALENDEISHIHDTVVDALGRIGDAKCLAILQRRLEVLTASRVLDPSCRVKIANSLSAIGRIARHPSTSKEQRNAIVINVFGVLPKDRTVVRNALKQLCAWNPGGLSPEAQTAAVHHIVDVLWAVDSHNKLLKGLANQKTELGSREAMCNILLSMGNPVLPVFLKAAETRVMQYSGAYMAVADVLVKIGDHTAFPLLQKMMSITMKMDEGSVPEHLRESFFDAATNDYVMLSRDKVAYTLVYSIDKVCGPKGKSFLSNIVRRIKNNEYDPPGNQTMSLLAQIIVDDGSAVAAAPSPTFDPLPTSSFDPVSDSPFSESAAGFDDMLFGVPVTQQVERVRQGDSLKSLLKDIRGKGLLGVKMEKRVSAIQEVAARKELEAISALAELLRAKDSILRSAAKSAILDMVRPNDPAPVFRNAVYVLIECMRGSNGLQTKVVSELFDQLRPEREPLKMILLNFTEVELDIRLKRDVADLFRIANERLARSGKAANVSNTHEQPGGAQMQPAGGKPKSTKPLTQQDIISLKRDYFAIRKAWISAGKHGPEPPRPPGV